MDILTLGFYAAVCAVLSLLAPLLHRRTVRLLIGAAVGLAAAALLPLIRQMMGGY